jgi:branched-chain amino acid transport system substrate-binding protein
VPKDTQAVYATFAGASAVRFTDSYAGFGLHGKIPVLGITTVHDYSVLPAEKPDSILGDYTVAQYCDGIDSKLNNSFTQRYHAKYGTYPGYYSESGYLRARVLLNALKRTGGNVADKAKFAAAMRSISLNAPRGPVTMDKKYWAPVQNVYVCVVKKDKNGDPRNVPVFTFKKVPLHGPLSEQDWVDHFLHDSAGRP